jgi:hypothetical protein
MRNQFGWGCVVVICAVMLGCSSAKVSNEARLAQPTTRPEIVYVGDFDLGATTIQSDPGTLTGRPRLISLFHNEDPAEQVARLQDLLTSKIVDDLNEAGVPAERLDFSGPKPAIGWLVTGEFLDLKAGNRAQRAVIGFGVGDSDAKLYVTLADLAHPEGQNLLNFNAQTNGDKTPGGSVTAVAAHDPWAAVAKFVIGRDASDKDIKACAKAVSDEIVKFMANK